MRLLVGVALLGAAPAAAVAQASGLATNSWETVVSQWPEPGACDEIDSIFVVPVRPTARESAITRLRDESAIPIDYPEVARLGFAEPPAETELRYERLLRQEIDSLHAERRRVLETRQGSWSRGDEARLGRLVDLAHEPTAPLLAPFLVRAVVMHERTGTFHVRICGDGLWVHHGSLGAANPTAIRLPVVVYLARRPKAVYSTWSIAY
jgi:hypothetical protein